MELIMIKGDRSPGLVQRILIELGRRGIEPEKIFMAHEEDKTAMFVEANVGKMNGRLLHALMGLQDVESAEYLHEDFCCFWKCSPDDSSDFLTACGGSGVSKLQKTAEDHFCKCDECEH